MIRSYKEKKYGSERNFLLLHRYGIDEATYDRMLREQNGKCAICVTRKAKHVDHCHSSKRIRALLCVNCNNGLGKFEDDVKVMEQAVQYLESPGPRVESP